MGVAAVVKHWVLNSQETNRNSQSSDADDRTLFEVYYPPFRAAVEAGVASVMCGYNQINGTPACGARRQVDHLRNAMGFEGFVMSDWWAIRSTSAALGGVDQEQPGGMHDWFRPDRLTQASADIDGMAGRVLTGLMMSGAFDAGVPPRPTCTPQTPDPANTGHHEPDCNFLFYQARVTSDAHERLAEEVAGAGVVLLKNKESNGRTTLPLRRGVRVALIGDACAAPFVGAHAPWNAADYYTMGGSGRVSPSVDAAFTIERGLSARFHAGELSALHVVRTADPHSALEAMRGYDVAIACGGGHTTEGADRPSLRLDQVALPPFAPPASTSNLAHLWTAAP